MRKFYDLTLELKEDIIVYPGDPNFEIDNVCSISLGDSYNISSISMGTHTGTHIDAPRHFYNESGTIDEISMDKLIGEVKVFDMGSLKEISKQHIEDFNIEEGDKIFFKTNNSKLLKNNIYSEDFVSLTKDAAEYLADKKVPTVGIDYLSIEKSNSEFNDVHLLLLKKDVVIVEGINLSDVEEGIYNFAALPLKIKDGDGAPARVVLWQ